MGLRHIKNTTDLIAVILPPVFHIGIGHTNFQTGLLTIHAAAQPSPILQTIDISNVRVLCHRQHDVGGAVLRIDRLRIQIAQIGVRLTGNAHHSIVRKLPQLFTFCRFLRFPVLVTLLLLLNQIV